MEAAADSPAPSENAPMHVPLNATDAPTYTSLSLVEDGGTTVLRALSSSAAAAPPAAMSTAVADVPSPLTMMPTAMPTTLFVELNLIYYYYLFIYHYVDCDVAMLRCCHCQSIRATATALPPSRCTPPPRFALPPPPTRPRHAAADVALSCCHHCHSLCAVLLW